MSHIRPKGSPVKNSALTSTGLVPFMERYSNSTREVAQDGRRGALMLSVSIKHPDSEAFIDAKMIEGKITGANVSVKLDDAFMQAAIDGQTYTQQYPINAKKPTTKKEISATSLWKKIVHNAWQLYVDGGKKIPNRRNDTIMEYSDITGQPHRLPHRISAKKLSVITCTVTPCCFKSSRLNFQRLCDQNQ